MATWQINDRVTGIEFWKNGRILRTVDKTNLISLDPFGGISGIPQGVRFTFTEFYDPIEVLFTDITWFNRAHTYPSFSPMWAEFQNIFQAQQCYPCERVCTTIIDPLVMDDVNVVVTSAYQDGGLWRWDSSHAPFELKYSSTCCRQPAALFEFLGVAPPPPPTFSQTRIVYNDVYYGSTAWFASLFSDDVNVFSPGDSYTLSLRLWICDAFQDFNVTVNFI